MIKIIEQNPMLGVMGALVLGGLLVCSLLGLFMSRGGASLRPIIFFAIAFGLVVLPQFVAHLTMAVKPGSVAEAGAIQPDAAALLGLPSFSITVKDGLVAEPEQVFGPSMPGSSFEDSRALFASRMPGLLAANTASLPTGETITALVFGDAQQTTDGLLAYLGLYEVAVELDRGGAEVKGKRGLGQDRMHLLRSGNAVLIVTALTEPMLEARVAAIPILRRPESVASPAAMASAGTPLIPAMQPLKRLFQPVWIQVISVLLLVLLFSIWFFKGAIWASSVPAEPGAAPIAESGLRERVLAVNGASVPMTVEELNDGRIAITWNYADARWTDLLNTHRMRRTHRLVLRFDAGDKAVRVTEQWSLFDTSVGMDGARLKWSTALGITFFQVDHRKVYGLQFGPDGRPTGDLSYTYRFNLQELKAPFIAAVTQAGWTWKPVLIDVPPALRWAVE
ncbi:MAG: hypothetical protein KIT10_01395 [Flavobacteriales bacterium]|nr:hypothetical protein [Flavobacteriales bacterium]